MTDIIIIVTIYSFHYALHCTCICKFFLPSQVIVTADKNSDESFTLKNIVRSVGTKLIREKLGQYVKELTQGLW